MLMECLGRKWEVLLDDGEADVQLWWIELTTFAQERLATLEQEPLLF